MALDSVLGHDRARSLLGRALVQRRLPQSLLFVGPEGVGKRTLALEVGRALLCAHASDSPCGECSSCRRSARSLEQLPAWRASARQDAKTPAGLNHRLLPDLLLVEPWPTGIKVEQARDLVAEVAGRPFEARARAFVVDDAHSMTEQAANALLKSLEEPARASHLILVSNAPQALLPTIRSRCQTLRLSGLPVSALAGCLRERLELSPEEARLRATLSGGSLGVALAFESDSYRSERDQWLDLLEQLESWSAVERIAAADRLADVDDLPLALAALRALLRDVSALRAGASPVSLLNPDVSDRLAVLAQRELGSRAIALAEGVSQTQEALRGHANRALALDVLLDALAT